jgi:hypothetical protein
MIPAILRLIGFLIGLMVAGYLLIGTGHAVYHFARESWRVLRVRDHSGPSPDPVPAGPAYSPYLLSQGWLDSWVMLRTTGQRVWQEVARLHRRYWRWFRDASAPAVPVSLPLGISLVLGTALLALPLAAGVLVLAAGLLTALLLWTVGLLLVGGTLGVADLLLGAARRIVVACPHPGCYHRFPRPVYACPADGCQQRHPELVPGRSGLLRHACRCGASLPTLVLLGRHRLTGYCPQCDRPLPRRSGRLRIEHVPVVGGPDAGKTTFLCLAIGAVDRQVTGTGGVVEWPDEREQLRWREALTALRGGERLAKTPVELPAAVTVELRPRREPGRILYLFDPAGETYDAAELLDSQRYLDHAEVALVVVDPLAIPGVWRSLTAPDHQAVARLAPAQPVAREGPGEMIDRLVGVLRTRAAGDRLRRVLVVVSKSDVLRETQVGQRLGERRPDVRAWLEEVGWGNWIRALEDGSGQVRYLASGLDIDDTSLQGAIGWLTAGDQDGRVRSRLRRLWPVRPAATRPWRATSRPDRIPRGHAAGRLVMQALGVPAALLAGAAPLVLLAGWSWSLLA